MQRGHYDMLCKSASTACSLQSSCLCIVSSSFAFAPPAVLVHTFVLLALTPHILKICTELAHKKSCAHEFRTSLHAAC